MILKFEELNKLFEEIDNSINQKICFYLIGGVALLYQGIKESTKDIDIIVDSKNEFLLMEKKLKKLDFATKLPTSEYNKIDLQQIFLIFLSHKSPCFSMRDEWLDAFL